MSYIIRQRIKVRLGWAAIFRDILLCYNINQYAINNLHSHFLNLVRLKHSKNLNGELRHHERCADFSVWNFLGFWEYVFGWICHLHHKLRNYEIINFSVIKLALTFYSGFQLYLEICHFHHAFFCSILLNSSFLFQIIKSQENSRESSAGSRNVYIIVNLKGNILLIVICLYSSSAGQMKLSLQ